MVVFIILKNFKILKMVNLNLINTDQIFSTIIHGIKQTILQEK